MLAGMSSAELSEWMAFERVTGSLDSRARVDISAGIVAATVANSAGSKRKLKPSDFIPKWFKRKKSVEDIWRDVVALNAQMGGEVIERGDSG